LVQARARLRRLNPSRFSAGERLEFVIGLGEALYLAESTGAAAALFDSALLSGSDIPADARDRILDWWATAMDRDARLRSDIERQTVYRRVRERMNDELARNLSSTTGLYWMAAAARAQGDLQAAWDAAQAGWVRASFAPDGGRALREDLQRLMQNGIIPERARVLGRPPESVASDWERFTAQWK
jgi:hypothetical protein